MNIENGWLNDRKAVTFEEVMAFLSEAEGWGRTLKLDCIKFPAVSRQLARVHNVWPTLWFTQYMWTSDGGEDFWETRSAQFTCDWDMFQIKLLAAGFEPEDLCAWTTYTKGEQK